MDFIDYPDREMLVIDLANKLAGELRSALEHEERVLMAVPGGTTPGPIFDDLCAADLDWSRVDVMLTDERWVPEDSARSNTRLLRERLLVNRAAAASYLPLYLPCKEPEERIAELETNILPRLPIQVLLLGIVIFGEEKRAALDKARQSLPEEAPVAAVLSQASVHWAP